MSIKLVGEIPLINKFFSGNRRSSVCLSLAPAQFSKTIVYAGELTVGRAGPIHVLGYQNTFRNAASFRISGLRSRRRDSQATGNAMILHFPAVPETMTRENIIDTSSCKTFLEAMHTALKPPMRRSAQQYGGRIVIGARLAHVEVFDHGPYTVVLADNPSDIPNALQRVAPDRRPPLNRAVFDQYAEWFPGWPVAVCCFSGTSEVKADPILWWYEPQDPTTLFAPGLDGHDGNVPRFDRPVQTDHWLIFGSDRFDPQVGTPVKYWCTATGDLAEVLPERVIGRPFVGSMPNGDFVASVEEIRKGNIVVARKAPDRELVFV